MPLNSKLHSEISLVSNPDDLIGHNSFHCVRVHRLILILLEAKAHKEPYILFVSLKYSEILGNFLAHEYDGSKTTILSSSSIEK